MRRRLHYIEREVEAADKEEAWERGREMALPSVAEAWVAGEVETDVFGWEAYSLEEIGEEQAAA